MGRLQQRLHEKKKPLVAPGFEPSTFQLTAADCFLLISFHEPLIDSCKAATCNTWPYKHFLHLANEKNVDHNVQGTLVKAAKQERLIIHYPYALQVSVVEL